MVLPGTVNDVINFLVPGYLDAILNQRRELVIDTSAPVAAGSRVVLDFRQVTQELGFVIKSVKHDSDGRVELEIEREEEFGLELPFPTPKVTFNSITITHVDENTIIYTGRNANTIKVAPESTTLFGLLGGRGAADFRGTLIGSTGIRPLSDFVSLGDQDETLNNLVSLNTGELTVTNTIDYANFATARVNNPQLGGIGEVPWGLPNLISPFPVHLDASIGGGLRSTITGGRGNRAPVVPGFQNGTLINGFDVREGGGLNVVVGTHASASIADDYVNSVPDEFRDHVGSEIALGSNTISVGTSDLVQLWSMES